MDASTLFAPHGRFAMGMVANASTSFMSPSSRTRDQHFHGIVMYFPAIAGPTKQRCLRLIRYDSYAA
jgi:hypothetical protein